MLWYKKRYYYSGWDRIEEEGPADSYSYDLRFWKLESRTKFSDNGRTMLVSDIRVGDANDYYCAVSDGIGKPATAQFHLTVLDKTNDNSTSASVIIGVVVAMLVVLVAGSALVYKCYCKKKVDEQIDQLKQSFSLKTLSSSA